MLLTKSVVIGLEGPHSSGKTTLARALAKRASASGTRAVYVSEQIRDSPFFLSGEAVGSWAEAHAFSRQIVQELLLARNNAVLVCDRTILSALAYWRIRVPTPDDLERRLFEGFFELAKAYVPIYDAIIYLTEHHPSEPDEFRDSDLGQLFFEPDDFWLSIDASFRSLFHELRVPVIDLPTGLLPDQAADWAIGYGLSAVWPSSPGSPTTPAFADSDRDSNG